MTARPISLSENERFPNMQNSLIEIICKLIRSAVCSAPDNYGGLGYFKVSRKGNEFQRCRFPKTVNKIYCLANKRFLEEVFCHIKIEINK